MKHYKRLFCLFSVLITCISATTHWMVTESGLIHPRLESQFQMENPSDLLAFLNQDTRWDNIINLYYDISERTETVRNLWSKLEGESVITTYLEMNKDCVLGGPLSTIDWYYASLFEDGKQRDIGDEDTIVYTPEFDEKLQVPDCKKISSLTFSMFAFEHLESMAKRENLSVNAEVSLTNNLSPVLTIEQFGHWLATKLHQNNSSWLHYNMASLYWRARGNATKAVECSRRAVLHAPRQFKDIPLLSLGTVLHRSGNVDDAVIILNAAVEHNDEYPINHFVLANAYAVIGDFNKSVQYFDKALNLNPSYELAKRHRHGALCHQMVMEKMANVQQLIESLKQELRRYSDKEVFWLKSQAAFLYTMRQEEGSLGGRIPDYKDIDLTCDKMTNLTGLNISALKKENFKNALMHYYVEDTIYKMRLFDQRGVNILQNALSLQQFMKRVKAAGELESDFVAPKRPDSLKMTPGEVKKEIGPMPEIPEATAKFKDKTTDEGWKEVVKTNLKHTEKSQTKVKSNPYQSYEEAGIRFPPTMKVNRNTQDFDTTEGWPTTEYCAEKQDKFPKNLNLVYPVFLPFENKGIKLGTLLSDSIRVPIGVEHELPWHPPICPTEKDAFTMKYRQKQWNVEVASVDYLRTKLLEYVSNGHAAAVQQMQDAEIGQRILTAINMNHGPKWVLFTLSSLYWRVRNNRVNSINCLLAASKSVPNSLKDIVYTSLASMYLELGLADECVEAAEKSFRVNFYEPATNFILAQWNMLKRQRITHRFHLKQLLRIQPDYLNGIPRNVLEAWECLFPASESTEVEEEAGDGDMCTQVEPGLGMLCNERDGHCHVANIRCYKADNHPGSPILRMLELQDDGMFQVEQNLDLGRTNFLDEIINNMPEHPQDLEGHAVNYRAMRRLIDKFAADCGEKACDKFILEELKPAEEDCSYQQLELGYWVHMVAYKQMFTDFEPKLPGDVLKQRPTSRKIPECQEVDTSDHFLLKRMSEIEVNEWSEPHLILMHQFAETFDLFDYVQLGSMVASYLESNPSSGRAQLAGAWWCGGVGRGGCARRCALAAAAVRPAPAAAALLALLHAHDNHEDAKEVAYLMLYQSPKSKLAAFLVAITHTYVGEYTKAIWMFRYAISLNSNFRAARDCLQATVCRMNYGHTTRKHTDLLSELEALKLLKEYGNIFNPAHANDT